MTVLRAFFRNHRQLAAVLLVLALCLKAVIPGGFMLSPSADTVLSISICADGSGVHQPVQITVPAKHSSQLEPSQKNTPCAFAGLADTAIGGADPFLLALAFAFILALGLAPMRSLPIAQDFRLRPPLRGPPVTA